MTLRQAQDRAFGEAAVRLCHSAGVLLGWRPGEFWEATPAELATALRAPEMLVAPDLATIEALKMRFPD